MIGFSTEKKKENKNTGITQEKDYPELVSEKRHFNNLYYLRELIKLKIDDWVEVNKEGGDPDFEIAMSYLEELDLVDRGLSNLYSKVTDIAKRYNWRNR